MQEKACLTEQLLSGQVRGPESPRYVLSAHEKLGAWQKEVEELDSKYC